jgi:hypothetical protein
MSVFRHGDRQLLYEIRGVGEPVLLVYGLAANSWDSLAPVRVRARESGGGRASKWRGVLEL